MQDYLKLFMDKEYPKFIDKYLKTKTLERLKHITQFCGCDYTKLYSPLFLYTRFDHSLVVAHMTWHFTHDKKETIVALLHDVGTPCFAHAIDYVFGDYLNQESSEKKITEIIKLDQELVTYLQEDGVSLNDLENFSHYPILENKSPKLCTDRLDGVLHTCFIWLHTHYLEQIKEIYDDLTVLVNEEGQKEIGFQHMNKAQNFVSMVYIYAKELQTNRNKYTMKFVSEMVKLAVNKNLITLDDLYTKKESEIVSIFKASFSSWKKFNNLTHLVCTPSQPTNRFYISLESKKRNTIPLVKKSNQIHRIHVVSKSASKKYSDLENFKDKPYAYTKEITEIE